MSHAIVRAFGALIVGAVLLMPFAAIAQSSAAPPTTAPTGKVPDNPAKGMKASSEVSTANGSTAVPGWNVPPSSWDAASETPQYASIPGRERNVLIQAEGREWRELRNGPITTYGGWLIGFAFFAIVVFYMVKGTIRTKEPPTGRLIERFNIVERTSHWTMAITFVILALTGACILWGKYLILPWLGHNGFSWIQIVGKNIHNFIGPLFIFSLLTTFLLFLKDNFFSMWDVKWLASLGGLLRDVPSFKFNAGEKMVFWGGLVFLGVLMGVSGVILDFPNWNQTRVFMQEANVIHAVAAACFISLIIGHAYLGTLGMEGAFEGMYTGTGDEAWAKDHHELWYEEVKAGKRPEHYAASRTQPATGD
jgi:formate dehydrogenase subunit gamma